MGSRTRKKKPVETSNIPSLTRNLCLADDGTLQQHAGKYCSVELQFDLPTARLLSLPHLDITALGHIVLEHNIVRCIRARIGQKTLAYVLRAIR